MRTIDLLPGTHIRSAAAYLVAHAPARAEFNGITIRARYATTRPSDLVAHFLRAMDLRGITYRHSPEGKRMAAERARKTQEAQAKMGDLLLALPDFDDPGSVLAWVEAAADPADRVGVAFDRDRLRAKFADGGWDTGVNCGEDFNGDDARNFAGWIVGQWLATGYPMVKMFVDQWRAKFGPAS